MAAGGSNLFTATFGNLRQYMKEQQVQKPPHHQPRSLTAGDLQLKLAPALPLGGAETGDRTMQLFPARPGVVPQLSKDLPEAQEKALLTILYQGQVHAFHDVPANKAIKLIKLAGTCSAPQAPPQSGSPAGTGLLKRAAELPLEELLDVPVRRTVTVQRFLHKRQYRAPSDCPDQRMTGENEPADFRAMLDEPSASWLHL
ncbi:hypothetical protein QOZ80_2AG0123530 [Eleusine coracana subsp. coracana]|nr:hypothetical protein QOZ80_2AG0123530 [Eleusine coracana subsp. coracana]